MAPARSGAGRLEALVTHFSNIFKDFWDPKIRSKNGSAKKHFLLVIFGIFELSGINSGQFCDPKRFPGGYFLVFFRGKVVSLFQGRFLSDFLEQNAEKS